MEARKCPNCAQPVSPTAQTCPNCGETLMPAATPGYYGGPSQYQPQYSAVPSKDKNAAGLLAILLGGIGIHHFYLGNNGMGILYLLFSWTGIPLILGIIEGIKHLTTSDDAWLRKYPPRY